MSAAFLHRALLLVLLGLTWNSEAFAQICETREVNEPDSGCGDISAPSMVRAGDDIIVSATFGVGSVCGGGQQLWVSNAVEAEILSGPGTLVSGHDTLYTFFCDSIYPNDTAAGTVVSFAGIAEGNHSVSVRFKIDDGLVAHQCLTRGADCGYRGPYAVLGGSNWVSIRAFEIEAIPQDISGDIVDEEMLGVSGVTVELSGEGTTTTSVTGHYGFNDILGGTYRVEPSHDDYYFEPLERQVMLTTAEPVTGVNFVAHPRLTAELTKVSYLTIPGRHEEPIEGDLANPFITAYGSTELEFTVTLRGADGLPKQGVTVTPASPVTGWEEGPYVTNALGEAILVYRADDPSGQVLVDGALGTDGERYSFTFQSEGGTSEPVEVPLRNNYAELVMTYVLNTPRGKVIELCFSGSIESLICAMTPGAANNFLFGANEYACGGYQATTLNYLDRVRLNPDGWNAQWMINGMDYGPVQFLWGGHQAVVVYHHSRTDTEWNGDPNSRFFDPWPYQIPRVFDMIEWVELVEGFSMLGIGPCRLYSDFPLLGRDYSTQVVGHATQMDPYFAVAIHSPATVVAERMDGSRFGLDGDGISYAEFEVSNFARYAEEDGSYGTYLELDPEIGDLVLHFYGTGDGPVTIDVWVPNEAQPRRYQHTITAGEEFEVAIEAGDVGDFSNGISPLPALRVESLPRLLAFAAPGTTTSPITFSRATGVSTADTLTFTNPHYGLTMTVGTTTMTSDTEASLDLTTTIGEWTTPGVYHVPVHVAGEEVIAPIRPITIAFDPTAPTMPVVRLEVEEETATVRWSSSDAETPITGFELAVGASLESLTMDWTDMGTSIATEVDLEMLPTTGDVFVFVRATNLAGAVSEAGAATLSEGPETRRLGGGCTVEHSGRTPTVLLPTLFGVAFFLLLRRRRF